MRDEFSYNIILLGGTGAKCGEILLHMCANGYFSYKRLNILYIDSDMENGNARKFRKLHEIYEECRGQYLIKSSPIDCFFYPEVIIDYKSPVGKYKYFVDLVYASESDNSTTEAAKALMGALYSDEEAELKISNGFFAHPNVGAAVFAANMKEIMKKFLDQIRMDLREMKTVKIFLLGSIFGGTGASSLPTIARYLKEELFGASDNKNIQEQMKIGGCMVLPYFLFSRGAEGRGGSNGEEPLIEADKFALKTKSALEYYKYVDEDEGRKTFDELYILGHDAADVRGKYAAAGSEQRNLPHVVELYAAMSAVTFFENPISRTGHYFAAVPIGKLGGETIYKKEKGYGFFFMMMRFAIVMKSLIIEELFDYTQKNKLRKSAKRIPWYYDFLNGKDEAQNFDTGRLYSCFEGIVDYCDEYIRWFAELNLSNIEKQDILDNIDYDEEKGDVVDYLSFFSKELLFRQHQNNQIRKKIDDPEIDQMKARNVYDSNLKYIRKYFKTLEKTHFNTDAPSEEISMDNIWSRISNMGFTSFVKSSEVFKNIASSEDKEMDAGVKNLVNAIFCACLF